MKSFLKTFLFGIIIIICLPLIAAILAIAFVVCVLVFLIVGIRSIIIFFTGGKPFGDLKEDVLAKEIIANRQQAILTTPQQQFVNPQNQDQYSMSNNEVATPAEEPTNPFEKYGDISNDIPKNDDEGGNL